jgi:hypothetical protein
LVAGDTFALPVGIKEAACGFKTWVGILRLT